MLFLDIPVVLRLCDISNLFFGIVPVSELILFNLFDIQNQGKVLMDDCLCWQKGEINEFSSIDIQMANPWKQLKFIISLSAPLEF